MGSVHPDWQRFGRIRAWAAHLACVLVAVAALAPLPAAAQRQDFALMRSEIADAVTLVNNADMDFGDIFPNATGGLVVMTSTATAVCTTTGGLVRTGVCKSAEFTGLAFLNATLRVQRPSGNRIDLTGPGGATMRLDTFAFGSSGLTAYLGAYGINHRFRVDATDGTFQFFVGGTLHVNPNQAPGRYNGSFQIRLDYN